jgi:hypothetical protein
MNLSHRGHTTKLKNMANSPKTTTKKPKKVAAPRKPCVSGKRQMAIQRGKLPTVPNQAVSNNNKWVGCQDLAAGEKTIG